MALNKVFTVLLPALFIWGPGSSARVWAEEVNDGGYKGCEVVSVETAGNASVCTAMESVRGERQARLREELGGIVAKAAGKVGVAVVGGKDTVTVNNGGKFPMMSVFKLHQALAVADRLEGLKSGLDTVIAVSDAELDRHTWSPMLKDYSSPDFDISVRKLLEYSITSSDNNASNLLFKRFVSPKDTERFVRKIAADTTFQILFSEEEMKKDHALSYHNYTSPLSAALLIKQVMETELIDTDKQEFIKQSLSTVTTGSDRLGAVCSHPGIKQFAHKTGSGYRNERGELMAHNDVGYFKLSDGKSYSVAVFISDFSGGEDEASQLIALISELVYQYFTCDPAASE